MNILDKLKINHRPSAGALDLLKYIGPGLLVTVGFIDPGNWATNLAAGSEFGYALLWVVTFSSIMLIIIQHNVAHLGIVTGLCLSEATNKYMPRVLSRPILISAMLASISTSLAEVLGRTMGSSHRRMDKTDFPGELHANHHECTGSRCHAPQFVSSLGSHTEPRMEP